MRPPITANHLAEIPLRWDGMIVTFAYDLVEGRVQVTDVSFRREDGGPVTWRQLSRRLPFSRLALEALIELKTHWAPQIIAQKPSKTAVEAAKTLITAPGPKQGRPTVYGAGHWAEVRRCAAKGGIPAVQARWSLSYATAWRWCREAAESV